MRKDPILFFAMLLAALMVYATLYPFHFQTHPSPFLNWNTMESRSSWLDFLLNLYFFMPLGLLLGIRYRSGPGFLVSLVACCLLSLSVEMGQAYIPGRHSSLPDVFLNTLGAFLGMMAAHLPVFDRELLDRRIVAILRRRGELLLVGLYLVLQFFPFIPTIRIAKFYEFRTSFANAEWVQLGVLEAAAFAFLVSMLVHVEGGRMAKLCIPVGLFLLMPFQAFLWGRPVQATQIVPAMFGFAVAAVWLGSGRHIPARILACIGLLLLALRQLQPFQWDFDFNRSLDWMPFRPTFEVSRDNSIRILSLKCFLYWYVLRQCRIAFGIPMVRLALALAGFLLVTELGQIYQPTRTPEITDPLLALMGALPFLALDNRDDQGL